MLVKVLEFDLPSGAGGMAPQMARYKIIKKFNELQKHHGLAYKSKTVGYTLNVWFENESYYTMFFLLYESSGDWRKFRCVTKEMPNE